MKLRPPPAIAYQVQRSLPGVWGAWDQAIALAWAWSGGWTTTSYYRSPTRNARVGGADDSQHLVGLALDATAPDLAKLREAFDRAGFITVGYPSHVHAQAFPADREVVRLVAARWLDRGGSAPERGASGPAAEPTTGGLTPDVPGCLPAPCGC